MTNRTVTVVVGVGPGLGTSVARRFAREGHAIALVARDPKHVEPLAAELAKSGATALAIAADTTEPTSVETAHRRIAAELGAPDVLVYNAGAFQMAGILDLSLEDFHKCWLTNCAGAFLWSKAVLPKMVERASGTLLFSGATAALRGSARFSALAVGKFGLRALSQSIAREFGPKGIHAAHVIIDGQIDTPRVRQMMPARDPSTFLSPDAIAETYWQLHQQHRTAWTLEMDLRPMTETF